MNTSIIGANLKEIETQGYTLVEDALTERECIRYVELLEDDYSRYAHLHAASPATSHKLNDKSQEKVVYNLHNKNLEYFGLFDHPKTWNIVEATLKKGSYQDSEAVNLLNISARNPGPYTEAQQLHLDSNLPGRGGFPLIVVVLYMLEDFTVENGATRLVPGSHLYDAYADTGKTYDNEKVIVGKRGTALIYNGATWHGGSKKHNDKSRWAVILGYGRWFIKPSFDFSRNIPETIYSQLSERRRRLLGLDSNPPVDEFTRITRRSPECEWSQGYEVPRCNETTPD